MRRENLNLLIKPTNDCNINCTYCFDRKMRESLCGTRMSLEMVQKIVSMAGEDAERVDWTWHGGEPTLMGQEFYNEVQEYFYANYTTEYIQTLQTNGLNLIKDNTWLETLEDNDIGYGMSYDIMSQETRTSASVDYESFIKDQVAKRKMSGAITVVNSTNIHMLVEMYEYAKRELGKSYIICYNPIFRNK